MGHWIGGLDAADSEPARLRRGDPDAFDSLLNRYQNRLFRYLAFLLVFSWTLALVGFFAVRVVAEGTVSILGLAALDGSSLSWPVIYFAAAWISGALLFVVLGLHNRKQRRLA